MSALAARRAAAAAAQLAAASTANRSTSSPIASSSKPTVPAGHASASRRSRTPSISLSDIDSGSEGSTGGPSKQARKNGKSPQPRYFAAAAAPTSASAKKRPRRQFSPSAPVVQEDSDGAQNGIDSSDDEAEAADAERAIQEGNRVQWSFNSSGPSTPRPGQGSSSTNVKSGVSRWRPTQGSNYYVLTSRALLDAGVLGKDAGGDLAGVMISLSKNESLMVAGLYSIVPLQGCVSLLSTTLKPSTADDHVRYPVFAPTSHPIPLIAPTSQGQRTTTNSSSNLLQKLPIPGTLLLVESDGSPRTVFLLLEQSSGMEKLKGGIVTGFPNIWLEERGLWGLRGIHPILPNDLRPAYPHVTVPSWTTALTSLTRSGQTGYANGGAGELGIGGYSAIQDHGSEDDDHDGEPEPIIALVKGPKRSGKSTLARAALNQLLERYAKVAWLECDLGQGEFSPGGVVGIWIIDQPVLGPSFTHPRIPEKAHYLGTYTPLTCPDEYIAAIGQLVSHFRYELQYPSPAEVGRGAGSRGKTTDTIPLVVNTQGWVKGLGEDLLRSIETMVQPSHIFAFESPTYDDPTHPDGTHPPGWTSSPPPAWQVSDLPFVGVPSHTAARVPVTHLLASAPVSPLQARYTASDFRTLSLISYFHAQAPTPTDRRSSWRWDFDHPLLAVAPWEVDLSISSEHGGAGLERVVLIGEGSESVLEEDLTLALRGSVVGLCRVGDSESGSRTRIYDPSEGLPALEETTFLGLALIRGVQPLLPEGPEGGVGFKLHLVTPLPADVLATANMLVRNGAIELPLCGMLDWQSPAAANEEGIAGKKWEDVPFLDVSGVVGVGGERRRFRRNLQRKGM